MPVVKDNTIGEMGETERYKNKCFFKGVLKRREILSGQNVYCLLETRNLKDNISDFKAQIAANNRGILLVKDLI